ncbi:MAG: penicillin-binding protein 2 [Candidatus Dadabacteria bacterium]|nr:MAG: penicillin-binding protein 2 [Candidatus Dadabacteria bacterium]
MTVGGGFSDPRVAFQQAERVRRAGIAALVVLLLLAARFFDLQVLHVRDYRQRALAQSSRAVTLLPERGLIVDRNGELVVGNQPGYRLRFYPDLATSSAATWQFLERHLTRVPRDLRERFEYAVRRRPYRPETLVDLLARDDLARVAAHGREYPELRIETVPLRRYPWGDLAAHLLGYLGEINDTELEQYADLNLYAPGDIIGKLGLERQYDPLLFGTKGKRTFRVDAGGRIQQLIHEDPARPGWNLVLTIDLDVQQAAEAALGERRGAVVAIEPNSGDILAIVSRPSYRPDLFIGGISHENWERLRSDPGHPLEYRPVRGQYPPGSTFKPLIALAALKEEVIRPDETIYCPGYYRLGRRVFRCWRPGGHGKVDLHRALVESCDTYFYEVGRRLGIERIAAYARLFGFGSSTGLDLDVEKHGLVPDPDWHERTGRGPWQEGDTLNVAIGQGSLLVTPLQLARFYGALATHGQLPAAHVRHHFEDKGRPAVIDPPPLAGGRTVDYPESLYAPVVEALEDVVSARHGTGGWARIRGVRVAGKTGTAQVVRQHTRDQELDTHLRDHAWFAAWAPVDNPRIAVAVIVENGGHGGSAAAPVARKVIEAWLDKVGLR